MKLGESPICHFSGIFQAFYFSRKSFSQTFLEPFKLLNLEQTLYVLIYLLKYGLEAEF